MLVLPTLAHSQIAIVLVNWNGWRECIECIDSVLAQGYPHFHIFIVDNDSKDHSLEQLIDWCNSPEPDPGWRLHSGVDRYTDRPRRGAVPFRLVDRADADLQPMTDKCRVTLIRSGGNLGFAGGCNVGINVAGLERYSHFWFLNPDTVVERRALIELIARAEHQPRMGIVGSTLLFYDRPDTVHAMAGGRLNYKNGSGAHLGEGCSISMVPIDGTAVERELGWVCGASMFVSTAFIKQIGPMAEDYFLYYEEADWAMRGRYNFCLGFAAKSLVFHKSGANSSKILPMLTAGFFYRSRLRFVKRFFPDRMAAAKRQLFVEMLRHIVRRRWTTARLVACTILWTPRSEPVIAKKSV